jgi:hypothetical protein
MCGVPDRTLHVRLCFFIRQFSNVIEISEFDGKVATFPGPIYTPTNKS